MYSFFGNVQYDFAVLLIVILLTYLSYHKLTSFGKEMLEQRELKKKLWKEYRFTYWELLNHMNKHEMKEFVKVFNNTFLNSKPSPIKCTDDVIIDFSPPNKNKNIRRRVIFDIPQRNP